MPAPSIVVDERAVENGLAAMLGDLLTQNLEQNPAKMKHFNRLKGVVAITALDAEVKLTMFFNKGSCTIYDGIVGKPDLHIETESETILGLSAVPLRAGLPDVMSAEGRDLIKNLFSGKLKIRGLLLHPLTLVSLTNVFSVN